MRIPAIVACLIATSVASHAACDVKDARIEESIASRKELREVENKQMVRDLRTLRDAALVLDTYKYPAECEQLIAIVKKLTANPEKSIQRSGDTDEEKAEEREEARVPKALAGEKAK